MGSVRVHTLLLGRALGLAGPAAAAPLQFTGTLTVAVGTLPLPPLAASGTALANGGNGGALQLLGGSLSTTVSGAVNPVGGTFATQGLTTPVTGVPLVNLITLTLVNGPAAFTAGGAVPPGTPPGFTYNPLQFAGGGLGGVMPLSGLARVCLVCFTTSKVITPSGTITNVNTAPGLNTFPIPIPIPIPIGVVGQGGTATGTGINGAIHVTVIGAPWTTGTVTAILPGSPNATAKGYDNRTASGGDVQLVTPLVVFTNLGFNFQGFATLTLDFTPVPEPGLAAVGLVALVGLGVALRARR